MALNLIQIKCRGRALGQGGLGAISSPCGIGEGI
jgi:hypothetical protein